MSPFFAPLIISVKPSPPPPPPIGEVTIGFIIVPFSKKLLFPPNNVFNALNAFFNMYAPVITPAILRSVPPFFSKKSITVGKCLRTKF